MNIFLLTPKEQAKAMAGLKEKAKEDPVCRVWAEMLQEELRTDPLGLNDSTKSLAEDLGLTDKPQGPTTTYRVTFHPDRKKRGTTKFSDDGTPQK